MKKSYITLEMKLQWILRRGCISEVTDLSSNENPIVYQFYGEDDNGQELMIDNYSGSVTNLVKQVYSLMTKDL